MPQPRLYSYNLRTFSSFLKYLTFALITEFGYHKKVFCKVFVGSNDKLFSISLNWYTLPSCLAYLAYRFDCILLFRNQNQLKVAQRFIQQQVKSIDNLMTVCRYVLIVSHKSTLNYNVLLLVTLRHSYVMNQIYFH